MSVHTRPLDELADIAVRRGEHLRRRRRRLRAVPGALVAVIVLSVALLRLGDDGSLTSVDTRPADRVEEDLAPAETRSGDDASIDSEVDAGAAPRADRVDPAPDPDVAVPDDVGGPVAIGPLNVLYVSGGPGSEQSALWQFDRQSRSHIRADDADLCRPSALLDGTIAYCRDGAIVIRAADGSGDHAVVASDATDPDLSPSGERLAYVDRSSGRDEIWTVGVDGSDRRQLTNNEQMDYRFPTWSPDGSQLAFVRTYSFATEVWIVDADGRHPRMVWGYGSFDAFPLDWSPDGRRLAFTCSPGLNAVCLLDIATGEYEAVTPDYLQATSPSWSPDGALIAFTAHPGTTTATSEVWVMRSDGTQERQLWPADTGDDPAWYPVFLPARPSTT